MIMALRTLSLTRHTSKRRNWFLIVFSSKHENLFPFLLVKRKKDFYEQIITSDDLVSCCKVLDSSFFCSVCFWGGKHETFHFQRKKKGLKSFNRSIKGLSGELQRSSTGQLKIPLKTWEIFFFNWFSHSSRNDFTINCEESPQNFPIIMRIFR